MPRSPYFEYVKGSGFRFLPNLYRFDWNQFWYYDYFDAIARVWIDKNGLIYKAEGLTDATLKWEAEKDEEKLSRELLGLASILRMSLGERMNEIKYQKDLVFFAFMVGLWVGLIGGVVIGWAFPLVSHR